MRGKQAKRLRYLTAVEVAAQFDLPVEQLSPDLLKKTYKYAKRRWKSYSKPKSLLYVDGLRGAGSGDPS